MDCLLCGKPKNAFTLHCSECLRALNNKNEQNELGQKELVQMYRKAKLEKEYKQKYGAGWFSKYEEDMKENNNE